jgi:hypothetical protein
MQSRKNSDKLIKGLQWTSEYQTSPVFEWLKQDDGKIFTSLDHFEHNNIIFILNGLG